MLRHADGDLKSMVADQVARGVTPDEALDDHLEFVRDYAQFAIPTSLAAAVNPARDVFGDQARIADPSAFAGQLESVFHPPYTAVLEEYGLPTPLTRKLQYDLGLDQAQDLDDVLHRLGQVELATDDTRLGPFETEMLNDTQRRL